MKLVNDSQKQWLEKGGSEEALTFIETVVNGLHTKALNEGIVYKAETEVQEEPVVEEVVTDVTEEVAEEVIADVAEEVAPVVTETAPEVKSIDFAAVLTETIFAAQKQYHNDVVVPLLAEIKSLKEAVSKTETKSAGVFSFDMSGLLPAAAVATRIQKEFGATPNKEVKGEPTTAKAITKREATTPADGNLLGGFLS